MMTLVWSCHSREDQVFGFLLLSNVSHPVPAGGLVD